MSHCRYFFLFLSSLFSTTLFAACTVSATAHAFGNYNPLGASNTDSVSQITVQCSSRTRITINLSTGQSGTYSTRYMSGGGSNKLNYNLYRNNGRNRIWGDGTGGSENISLNIKNKTVDIYGRIPAGQNTVAVGSYTDSLTVTVEY